MADTHEKGPDSTSEGAYPKGIRAWSCHRLFGYRRHAFKSLAMGRRAATPLPYVYIVHRG